METNRRRFFSFLSFFVRRQQQRRLDFFSFFPSHLFNLNPSSSFFLLSSSQPPHSARYRGVGTDLSKVPLVARSPTDSGSTEAQVARLSARVIQLTAHLKEHKKDYGATRGLMAILGQRRRLLRYLFKKDRACYEKTIATLNVRPLKAQSSRGVFVKLGGAAATAAAEGTQ